MKTCSGCALAKPLADYYKYGRRCKTCHKARSAQSNREHSVERAERARAKYLRRKADDPMYLRRVKLRQFGMELEEYERVLAAQGGGCGICGAPPSDERALCVDHDHGCCDSSTRCCGRCVRGLLCDRCNRMLGHAKDDAQLLRSAVDYLEEPPFAS